MRKLNITGTQFGRLTALSVSAEAGHNRKWICLCECGKLKPVLQDSLLAGKSRSCGCLHRELLTARLLTHGSHRNYEYTVWAGMIQRCTNPKSEAWKNYGGRGITVCDRWRSFQNFKDDMPPRPKGASIERVKINEGYSPENCIWADRKAQNSNTRRSRWLTIHGKTMTMNQWAEKSRVPYSRLKHRINSGWNPERAICP
jgi:hypothetical protein